MNTGYEILNDSLEMAFHGKMNKTLTSEDLNYMLEMHPSIINLIKDLLPVSIRDAVDSGCICFADIKNLALMRFCNDSDLDCPVSIQISVQSTYFRLASKKGTQMNPLNLYNCNCLVINFQCVKCWRVKL